MLLSESRTARAVFESLSITNRDPGSGGGSGFLPLINLGYFAGGSLGTYSTANPTTWTDITGTSFTIQINRTTPILYWVFATATTPGAGSGYIRGDIVGYDATQPMYMGGAPNDGFVWYLSSAGPIQPGLYTVKTQIATDNNGISTTVNQIFHQVMDLGA
jgi:hypothetical protein